MNVRVSPTAALTDEKGALTGGSSHGLMKISSECTTDNVVAINDNQNRQ